MALIDLERAVAVTVVREAKVQLWRVVEKIRKKTIATITNCDCERIRNLCKQMNIVGLAHLYRYLHIDLDIRIKRQETPKDC